MKFIFAGGAREVGGSCIYLRIAGYGVLLDAGIRQSANKDPLPDFLAIQQAGGVDVIIVSHAHMDHTGSLPLISKAYPAADIYMTPMTMELTSILLKDALKIMSRRDGEVPLYTETDVSSMRFRIKTCPFQKETEILPGLTMTFLPAGHIAGAACIYLVSEEGSVLYTGDLSLFAQKTIEGSYIPKLRPDVMISESTYGNRLHSNRQAEENRLIALVNECIQRGGKILIPSFALGRAQEVLLILRQAFTNKQIPVVPVYVDGMVRDICSAYMNHPTYLRNGLARRIMKGQDPFYNEHIQPVSVSCNREELLQTAGAMIFVASSGMLNGGPSLQYAKTILKDENACVILTGYQDEESPGSALLKLLDNDSEKTITLDGTLIDVKCQVHQVGLSAHGDQSEILSLADRLAPRHMILVHGDEDAMETLGNELALEYRRRVYQPVVGEQLDIELRNPRRQMNSHLPYTMGLSECMDEKTMDSVRTFWMEKYSRRMFTADKVYELVFGMDGSDDAVKGLVEKLLASNLFIRDARRLYLITYESEENIAEKKKDKPITLQQIETIVRQEVKDIDIRKIGCHFDRKEVLLTVDYPDACDPDSLEQLNTVLQETAGWHAAFAPAMNHQAAAALLIKLFGMRVLKTSHRDDMKYYTITLSGEDVDDEKRRASFTITTGWKLLFKGEQMSSAPSIEMTEKKFEETNDWFMPVSEGKPLEQNMALAMIDSLFLDAANAPYKKGIFPDASGRYIELSFLTPQLGRRCADTIRQCAQQTHWRMHISSSVNQNAITAMAAGLCEQYQVKLFKNPSYMPLTGKVMVNTDIPLPEELIRTFNEMTGMEIYRQ